MFYINSSCGFTVTFDNGYSVSVAFHPYCNSSNKGVRETNEYLGEQGAKLAEIAVFDSKNNMVNLPGGVDGNWADSNTMMIIMAWAKTL